MEENGEEKEFENNQFLKSVVKDIDKLTQKMLNTNNNLSGLNTSHGFKLFLIISELIYKILRKASDYAKQIPKKPPMNEVNFSSNQQSETR